MNNENASKEMVKSFIDLAKGLIDGNKQPSRGRGDESGELHSVGAGESFASTTTDTNASSAKRSTRPYFVTWSGY